MPAAFELSLTNNTPSPAIAHMLEPKTKSPLKIDADGFKRFDGKPIDGHSAWWKIWDYLTADLYDKGTDGLAVDVTVKLGVKENNFGEVVYDRHRGWGEPIREITKVEKIRKTKSRVVTWKMSGGCRRHAQFL